MGGSHSATWAAIDADGYIYLSDRQTDMILVGGSNVYPAEVEVRARRASARAFVARSSASPTTTSALARTRSSRPTTARPIDDDELRAFLADRLVRYKVPRTFEFVGEPLRDDAGKLRRSALRADRL